MPDKDCFGFEIDFLPVGEKSKSGDAICARWGYNLSSSSPDQFVMVVDGGFVATGDEIIAHIKRYYQTKVVDLVVNTHPHADHVGGLEKVLTELDVKNIALHRPWRYEGLLKWLKDGRVTDQSVRQSLRDGLECVYRLEHLARQSGVKILDPFSPLCLGTRKGVSLYILGPREDYYKSLIPSFNVTPLDGEEQGRRLTSTGAMVAADDGRLTNDGQTSAENNSGVILCLTLPDGGNVLLTGDAGMPALKKALAEANMHSGTPMWRNLRFLQVPHHGSVQNLGPAILDGILGVPGAQGSSSDGKVSAYISVSKNPEFGHPARCVTNALREWNAIPYETHGRAIRWKSGTVPFRDGWSDIECIQYFDSVEKWV